MPSINVKPEISSPDILLPLLGACNKILKVTFVSISVLEIILKAKKIQEEVNENPSNGIGIYRLGIQRGIPTYYIGEYIDKAEFLNE